MIAAGQPGRAPTTAARGRRILVLSPFPPSTRGAHGGSRAIAQLVTALAARNRVALAYLRAGDERPIEQELAGRCELVLEGRRHGSTTSSVRPLTLRGAVELAPRLGAGLPLWVAGRWSAAFAGRVAELAARWRPDVLQAEFSVMGQYLPAAGRGAGVRVATFHEPAAAAAAARGASAGLAGLLWRAEARRWRRFEAALLGGLHAAVAFTPRDADVLRRLQDDATPIEVVPIGVPLAEPTTAPPDGPPRLLFVGNFGHVPNVDAAHHLVEEIFPPLRRRMPALELWLVGPGAPARLRRLASDGVIATGCVPDVAAHLAGASVVVAPLRLGGGMRVKVLEAMAAGKAIVASPLAVEGLRVRSGRELLVAGDAPAFRDAVAELLGNPELRTALGRAARARVAADHAPDGVASAYESLYDRLGAPTSPPHG